LPRATRTMRAGVSRVYSQFFATRLRRGQSAARDVCPRSLAAAQCRNVCKSVNVLRDCPFPAPSRLEAARLDLGGEEYLVLSHALPSWKIPPKLSRSERDVVVALLRGASHRDIARARGVSLRTIANLIANAFRKLDVRSRIELAALLCDSVEAKPPER
jgi:DNA-binding NarL/FixJ family response regulator